MRNFKARLRNIWGLLRDTISEWEFNEVSVLAASLAYYTVFSLAPLLIIVMIIVGAIFGEEAAKEKIVARMTELVGVQAAEGEHPVLAEIPKPKAPRDKHSYSKY